MHVNMVTLIVLITFEPTSCFQALPRAIMDVLRTKDETGAMLALGALPSLDTVQPKAGITMFAHRKDRQISLSGHTHEKEGTFRTSSE